MNLLCSIGIHNSTSKVREIPESHVGMYHGAKSFSECPCGSKQAVIYIGGTAGKRDFVLEALILEDRRKALEELRKKKAQEEELVLEPVKKKVPRTKKPSATSNIKSKVAKK